jgi:hypothetical protein
MQRRIGAEGSEKKEDAGSLTRSGIQFINLKNSLKMFILHLRLLR